MPPWKEIDTVMFDMDGTLLDLHFDSYFWQTLLPRTYAKQNSLEHDEAMHIVTTTSEQVYGTLDWYCLDYWRDTLGIDITSLKQTITNKIQVRPNVEALLSELNSLGKRVLLVTNAHPHSLDLKMQHTSIAEFFHQRISSHQLDLAKENEGFWGRLQILEAFDPERTLLFDDSLPVLRQARREGIGHLFAIHQPDSERPGLEPAEFAQVHDFGDIMPSRHRDPEAS